MNTAAVLISVSSSSMLPTRVATVFTSSWLAIHHVSLCGLDGHTGEACSLSIQNLTLLLDDSEREGEIGPVKEESLKDD